MVPLAGKGGGEDVQYGYKGKGLTLHALVDGNGMPFIIISTSAADDEREQVEILLDAVSVRNGKVGRPKKQPGALQADKGYDSRALRNKVRSRGIKPMIPRRSWPNRKSLGEDHLPNRLTGGKSNEHSDGCRRNTGGWSYVGSVETGIGLVLSSLA